MYKTRKPDCISHREEKPSPNTESIECSHGSFESSDKFRSIRPQNTAFQVILLPALLLYYSSKVICKLLGFFPFQPLELQLFELMERRLLHSVIAVPFVKNNLKYRMQSLLLFYISSLKKRIKKTTNKQTTKNP